MYFIKFGVQMFLKCVNFWLTYPKFTNFLEFLNSFINICFEGNTKIDFSMIKGNCGKVFLDIA